MSRANSGLEAALNQCIVQSLVVSFKRTRIYHDNITAIFTTDTFFFQMAALGK